MSLLTNALRTVFEAARAKPLPEEPPPEPEAAPQDAPMQETIRAALPTGTPAWKLLASHTGVQDVAYEDHARTNIQQLFARAPRRLLDIGCATGAVGAALKQVTPELWVWGCELNEAAAQVAATRLDRVTTAPRERWGMAEIDAVRTVDTVLLLDVLEHMYNPWAELEFLAQKLPPNAQVIVSLPNIGHYTVVNALAAGQFPYAAMGILDVTHVRFFTLESMCAMFEETGFAIEEMRALSRTDSIAIQQFPARLAFGKLTLQVDSPQEWERLNTVQFGFRLRARRA